LVEVLAELLGLSVKFCTYPMVDTVLGATREGDNEANITG
jgi:hypothetical protein